MSTETERRQMKGGRSLRDGRHIYWWVEVLAILLFYLVYSAIRNANGSHPKGAIHPLTLDTLRIAHLPAEGLRSKSWDEFARADAPKMDFVITVCDSAAGEVCPVWPGQPVTAHWGFPDPAGLQGRAAGPRAPESAIM